MAIRKKLWVYPDANMTMVTTGTTSNGSNTLTTTAVSDYLRIAAYIATTGGNQYIYSDMSTVTNYVIQSGDYLEYDIYWEGVGGNKMIGMDLFTTTGEILRNGSIDQNGLAAHPGTDLSSKAQEQWYHRIIPIDYFYNGLGGTINTVGKTIDNFIISCEMDTNDTFYARIKNVAITDGKGVGVYNTRNFVHFLGSINAT
jgi:hypothetical protein